jgi:hypothetical protein
MLELNDQLKTKLDLICQVHNISQDEAVEALQWIINPTLRPIVGIREFIESPHYMNASNTVYEKIMVELEACNNGDYSEAVFTGSIGSGKTTAALYTTAYQLYVLSCYENPHGLYGLDPASEIVFVFQSLNLKSATNDYARFAAMIEKAPYFRQFFPFDKDLSSKLVFPNRIIVNPVSGAETATIGENVFGGLIDEVNFMAVVDGGKSKSGQEGVYDQAIALYNSISKRRKSRFGMGGKLPGMLCLVSSRRYPGQFTDVKEEEAAKDIQEYGKTSIFIYSKRVWEIKDGFSENKFPIFVGDEARKPRIIEEQEDLDALLASEDDKDLVDWIPDDFLDDFRRDMITSLRDIAGLATLATHPFIVNRESIKAAVRNDPSKDAKNYVSFSRERVDFAETQLQIAVSQILNPQLPRFFHCDLAITGDSAGFAIGCCTGFRTVTTHVDVPEVLPLIHIDALLEIAPPRGGEIKLFKVRDIIHVLRKMGVNVRWGTFDQFQSRDSMQLMRQAGLSIGYQSIDINTAPYDFTKNALYDGRLSLPPHARCQVELASLEKNTKKNKIDHPPGGSKDVADALAGVVYGLTMRREIWAQYGIQAVALPSSVKKALDKEKQDKITSKV